jgi:hypothetical protein
MKGQLELSKDLGRSLTLGSPSKEKRKILTEQQAEFKRDGGFITKR